MKANELQIGDWVSLTKKGDIAPCVVTGLHPKELFVIQPGESAGDVLSYDTIYPIPISAEILEKNGFDYNGIVAVVTGRICDGVYEKHFNYVHELQRALRLCGLNDLADNFKV